ncbi:MAG: hypothetical protein WD278_18780 [Pirellulales bacterium]
MKRPLVLLCAALVAGCQSTAPSVDPFLGRKTVPPPGTGTAGAPLSPDPYYPGSAPYSPGSTAHNPYAPPGGSYQFPQQGSLRQTPNSPRAAQGRPDQPAPAAQPAGGNSSELGQAVQADYEPPAGDLRQDLQGSPVQLAGYEADEDERVVMSASDVSEIRIIEPPAQSGPETARPRATSVAAQPAASLREPGRHEPSQQAIDIMDLPAVNRADAEAGLAGRTRKASRPAAARAAERPAADPGKSDRYGYAADYRSLRGQLEFSLIDRQWKLRYIPIDGDTDDYGGSVVLHGHALDDFRPGEFVAMRGQIEGQGAAGTFAAAYRVDHIQPLSR